MQTDDIRSGTKDYLRGFSRGNDRGLAALLEVTDWQRIARLEIERRSTRVVEALDDATLQAIAAGTLDLRALLDEVAQDLSTPR